MNTKAKNNHLLGLDGIRFMCACWVFIFHSAWMMGVVELPDGSLAKVHSLPSSILTDVFSGPAAVIVFFVISGLVVHYPHVGKEVDLYSHFSRRFIRVCGPIVMLAVALPLFTRSMTINDLPVWSLWCELVYYALYPAILLAKKRFGLPLVVAFGFAAALLLAVAPGEDQGAFVARGNWLTWILGLPTWLLGMLLAEQINSDRIEWIITRRPLYIWIMRGCIVALGGATYLLRFHTPIGEQISLLLFAIPTAVWLFSEVNFAIQRPPRCLVRAAGTLELFTLSGASACNRVDSLCYAQSFFRRKSNSGLACVSDARPRFCSGFFYGGGAALPPLSSGGIVTAGAAFSDKVRLVGRVIDNAMHSRWRPVGGKAKQ